MQAALRKTGDIVPVLDAIVASCAILAEADLVTADAHFQRIPGRFGLRAYAGPRVQ